MSLLRKIFAVPYVVIAFLCGVCGLALTVFAAIELFQAVVGQGVELKFRLTGVLEALGLLTIAVAALELSQTIVEEEVRRDAQMSGPTRVRRFLSRFMVVIVVSLAIESVVAVFRFLHEDPSQLFRASAIALSASLLLVSWGAFIWLNRSAEELEPEAMRDAKAEDKKVS